jgi:integrase/recombinase XerD
MDTPKIIDLIRTKGKTLIETLREFNRQDAVENGHSAETVYKYENFTDNFERYLSVTGQGNLLLTDMSVPVLKYFILWLPENLKSCNRTHISKHIYRINRALDYASTMGLIPFNPCAALKVKRGKNKEVINLDDSEFLTWINAKWKTVIYQHAQDDFTFSCVTGLSYMDLFSYQTHSDKNGLWIESNRGKTKKPYYVPLWHDEFIIALQIHEKYNGKLPYLENHNYNRLIREMAAQLGIEKYLTTHIGRKTFATHKDEGGWELGPLAAMMGNTEKVLKEHYINISKKKILTEIRRRA